MQRLPHGEEAVYIADELLAGHRNHLVLLPVMQPEDRVKCRDGQVSHMTRCISISTHKVVNAIVNVFQTDWIVRRCRRGDKFAKVGGREHLISKRSESALQSCVSGAQWR